MSDSHQRPFSIKIFVPNGDPDGLRIVERSNWTGVGVVFNRTNYKQVVTRPEYAKTGVYILVGTSEESSLPTVYIGEGDPVKNRIDSHQREKDFWDWAIFFVTKDESMNKAHVKHLESRLYYLAKDAKKCNLDNSQTSQLPSLSEAETADVESFLLDMLNIFPLLNLDIFEKTITSKKPRDLLCIKSKGIIAKGYEDPKGFVVCRGSQAVKDEAESIHHYMTILRKDLLDQRVLADKGKYLEFTQDQVFKSPSTSAGVILGRTANGRIEWKTTEGVTLKILQAEAADSGVDDV